MKLAKRILLALLVLILVSGIGGYFYFKNKFMGAPPNRVTVSHLGEPFDFIWGGETISGSYEPHAFIFVPVSIPGVDRQLHMQFDMGAHSTVFLYENIRSINEHYGDIFQIDTVDNHLQVTNPAFTVGTVQLAASAIDFRGRGRGIDWSDTTAIIKIGTVGSDFMEHHPLIMDFKHQRITLAEAVPDTLESTADFQPLTFEGRKIFLSAQLNGEPMSLWFDSGSSAFELIVEEKTFLALATPGAERETGTVPSWGTEVTMHNIGSSGEFQFGSTTVPLTYVTYFEWPNKLQAFMMKMSNIGGDLGGMTGNKLFLGKTLVLDAPNLRYALME